MLLILEPCLELFPLSYLFMVAACLAMVVSMLKLDYAEHQRFTLKWSVINCFILLIGIRLAANRDEDDGSVRPR